MTRAVQDWNAQAGKVTNLRDPTDMSDAVTVNYLKYGYLNSNGTSLTNNIKDAVTRFQETFGLQVTGYENEETLKLMDTPRCGNSDEGIAPFSVNPLVKWNSTRVTWNMIGSGSQYANIVERAFSLYSKHSALEFRRSYSNPTLMVVIYPKKHVAYYLKSTCSYDFDGPGGVLGHAFLLRPWLNQSDIHLDFEEDWDFTMNIPATGEDFVLYSDGPRNRPCSRSSAFVCVTIRTVIQDRDRDHGGPINGYGPGAYEDP
ncbi:matrilysin-like [Homalodisca vitripennis]|uniref:matrilysin-like n=1 Tax=Homalodisca vitripennis TaxID=197043 RepID=UPI001EE9E0DB|nr:matrilysin-like [Homalodisca vitripennis]